MTSFLCTDLAVRLMGLVSSRDRPDAPLRPTGTAVCLYDLVLSRAEPVPVAERLGLWFPCQKADQDPAHRQALRDQILQQPMPLPVGAAEDTEDGAFLSPGLLPDLVLHMGVQETAWLGPYSTKTAQVMTQGPIRLPRWPITRLKLLDITPDQKGAPYAGAPVTLLQRDGFVEGRSLLWLGEPQRASGHLEESLDEHGQPALTISDPLFRAVMPVDAPRPFVLAGFHMSFLHRVLGGPQDRPPYDLCLYRLARQRASWLRPCGLQESVLELRTDLMTELTRDGPFLRLHCATALLETLLEWEPLNRLLVLSGNVVSPPPGEEEPFGQAAEWSCLPQGPAMLEE